MFKQIPANAKSLYMRKPLYGVGINDAPYKTVYMHKQKQYVCPYYQAWKSILQRCYAKEWHEKYPTYKNCTLSKDWFLFSNFQLWMKKQNWQGQDLDKDILISGNKHYGPKTCVFISPWLNRLLIVGKNTGSLPRGVAKNKNKFMVRLRKQSKSVFIGLFLTEAIAAKAYLNAKAEYVEEIAEGFSAPLSTALLRISNEIRIGKYY